MLRYKRTDVVVYFSLDELEYRRVGNCWEECISGKWAPVVDCNTIESQYKERIDLRNKIKRRDELSSSAITSSANELSTLVASLINTLGMSSYIDNTTSQLLDKLDSGEISIKNI